MRARVTLVGGLTFSLINTPGRVNPPTRVNVLIVSRPFDCDRTLSCPGL